MLRFAVHDDRGPAREWPLHGAHLLGPEDLAVPGSVRFDDGQILCQKSGTQAAALCLQYDAGECGRLMLQTCLLPDREQPYILSVELARHRIKTFIVKSEEWQMFELEGDHPAMRRWLEAKHHFTEAITIEDPVAADRVARQALACAIDACERLAMAHADVLLHLRFGQRAAPPTTLGVRVWPGRDDQPLRDLVEREFDLLFLPLTWRQLEVEEGVYRWEQLDRWMEFAQSAGKPIVAGPLLDFSKAAVPDWMYVWQHDYDTCRDLAYDHVQKVVERYRSAVSVWSLAAGINTNENFQFAPEQMIDLVRMAGLQVRQTKRKARAMIEVVQPFGESCARTREAVPPLLFIERLVQEGIRLDAIGLRLLMGSAQNGQAARDLMALSALIDRFFYLELPIIVSAAGVPSEALETRGGSWHGPWSPETQAKWATRLFTIAMSKPLVESIAWTDLYDHRAAELPRGGLIDEQGRTKPALAKLLSLRKRLRKPLGELKEGILKKKSAASP